MLLIETLERVVPRRLLSASDDSIWTTDWQGKRLLPYKWNVPPVPLLSKPASFEASAVADLRRMFPDAIRYVVVRHLGGRLRHVHAVHFRPVTNRFERL